MSRVRHDDESGFTVVELAIVMLISATVMGSLIGILDSQSRAERRINALASNQEQVRLALVQVQQDLRSAEPLVELDDISKYPTQMNIMHRDFDDDDVTYFRWRLNTVANELVRETLATDGSVAATTFRLAGVTSNTVFRYFKTNGAELQPDPTQHTSRDIADCTVRVRILIDAAPEKGPQPLDNWSDVQLRNRLPGGVGCS
ncbi:MAG: hypothetical protein M3Q68_06085 [Actinomycetota bacterium]|nr:hypothetical protein [Actinomycetota bacterium]